MNGLDDGHVRFGGIERTIRAVKKKNLHEFGCGRWGSKPRLFESAVKPLGQICAATLIRNIAEVLTEHQTVDIFPATRVATMRGLGLSMVTMLMKVRAFGGNAGGPF